MKSGESRNLTQKNTRPHLQDGLVNLVLATQRPFYASRNVLLLQTLRANGARAGRLARPSVS